MKPEAPTEGARSPLHGQAEGRDDIPTCPRPISSCPHNTLEASKWQACWMQDEVTVLLTATVDLLALNPSITSYGIHPNERTGKKKAIQLCSVDSSGNETRDSS